MKCQLIKSSIYIKALSIFLGSSNLSNVAHAEISENSKGTNIETTKTWTKEELNQKPQNIKNPDLFEIMASYTKFLLVKVGNNQKHGQGFSALHQKYKEISKEDYLVLVGASKKVPQTPNGTTGELGKTIAQESIGIIGNEIKANSEFLKRISDGLNFELGPELFASKKSANAKGPRYGLILKDIKKPNEQRDQAAINSDMEQEFSFATEADPVWTIGPLPEERATLFNFDDSHVVNDAFFTAPDFRFKGKIAPASDFIKSFQDTKKVNLKYSLVQSQGFYEISHITKNQAGVSETYQIFTLPVIATLNIQKKYDVKGKILETRGNGLLLDKTLPSLNVIFDHNSEKYAAEAKYSFEKHQVSFEAKDIIDFNNDKKNFGVYKLNYSLSI